MVGRFRQGVTQQHNTTCNTLCYTASSVLSLCYARPCYKRCNTCVSKVYLG